MNLNAIKVVVFDLGGVLLQLRDPVSTFGLTMSEADFMQRWLLSPAVRELERGAVDLETFSRAAVAELDLLMDWQEFLQRFDAWPERIFPDTIALLDAVPEGIERALLSNTNAAHWGRRDIADALAGRIDRTFLSFRTGLLKPDAAAFEHVAASYSLAPDSFLFFDDNPLNIAAATASGMHAFLCKGPSDALRVLRQI